MRFPPDASGAWNDRRAHCRLSPEAVLVEGPGPTLLRFRWAVNTAPVMYPFCSPAFRFQTNDTAFSQEPSSKGFATPSSSSCVTSRLPPPSPSPPNQGAAAQTTTTTPAAGQPGARQRPCGRCIEGPRAAASRRQQTLQWFPASGPWPPHRLILQAHGARRVLVFAADGLITSPFAAAMLRLRNRLLSLLRAASPFPTPARAASSALRLLKTDGNQRK